MEPDYLRDDLKQEVILIICQLPDEKLFELHKSNALDFYTVKVILNQIKSNTSPFYKKYRQPLGEFFDDKGKPVEPQWEQMDFEERQVREDIEDMAIEEIDKQYWYNKALIELYRKHGNFRSIQDETGIPWVSCYKTIKKTFQEIKEKLSA